jgi:hypothetical protein
MMNKILGVLAASVLSLAASGAFGQANLVLNGGFETGDFTDWNVNGVYTCVGASDLCLGLGPTVDDFDPLAHSGTYAAYLNGPTYSPDTLSQSISTATPGAGYYVTFWLATEASQNTVTPNFFDVVWDSQTVGSVVDGTNPDYVEYSFWVRGTGADTLTFFSGNDPGGFVLDDVSVTSAPEPAALGLLLVGMTAVSVAARRRRAV